MKVKKEKATKQKTEQKVFKLDKFTNVLPSLLKEIPAQQGEAEKKMADEKNSKPEHVRVGSIEVAIWVNNNGKGDYQTVTMQRSYKDKDDKWAKTNTLRVNDIPTAILALEKAYEKIVLKE